MAAKMAGILGGRRGGWSRRLGCGRGVDPPRERSEEGARLEMACFGEFWMVFLKIWGTICTSIPHSKFWRLIPLSPWFKLTPMPVTTISVLFWASPFLFVSVSSLFFFCLVPWGRLSWLLVSFWAHANIVHHIISYHIISYHIISRTRQEMR